MNDAVLLIARLFLGLPFIIWGVMKLRGGDAKLVAVPHDKLTVLYKDVQEYTDLPALLIEQIKHFFENYKDLEKGKWVKVEGWGGAEEARGLINKAVAAYQK